MNQQFFVFMSEELAEIKKLEEKEKETLIFHMTRGLIEVLASEGRKADDN